MLSSCSHFVDNKKSSGQGFWEKLESDDFSAPTGRHAGGFINVDNKLYLIGGRGMKPLDIYDIEHNIWIEKSPPPIEIHHFQPVAKDHLIYILGAMAGPYPYEKPIEHIIIYDTVKDEWLRGADIPEHRRRGSTGSVIVNDFIYMFCGIKNGHIGDHKNWTDRYDIKNNQWVELADAPRARDHFQAEQIGNKIYLVGGRTTKGMENAFKNTVKEVDVFDLNNNTWSTIENTISTQRAGVAVSKYEHYIIVAGGESFYQSKAHNEVEILNTRELTWSSIESLPIGRHGTGMSNVDGHLYISTGGTHQGGGPELGDLYTIDLTSLDFEE